jgi:hypothetical protein
VGTAAASTPTGTAAASTSVGTAAASTPVGTTTADPAGAGDPGLVQQLSQSARPPAPEDEVRGGACDGHRRWLVEAARVLDRRIQPTAVSGRVAETGYWHAERVTYQPPQHPGKHVVLVGDAACGRPFYLGSTLNGHFRDLTTLIGGAEWARWDPAAPAPFKQYTDQMRRRTSGLCFRGAERGPPSPAAAAAATPAPARSPPSALTPAPI